MNPEHKKHLEALDQSYKELLKKNTQMNALITYREKEMELLAQRCKIQITELDTKHKESMKNVLEYLVKNNLLNKLHYENIAEMLPIEVK
jgi:hypothetical protein